MNFSLLFLLLGSHMLLSWDTVPPSKTDSPSPKAPSKMADFLVHRYFFRQAIHLNELAEKMIAEGKPDGENLRITSQLGFTQDQGAILLKVITETEASCKELDKEESEIMAVYKIKLDAWMKSVAKYHDPKTNFAIDPITKRPMSAPPMPTEVKDLNENRRLIIEPKFNSLRELLGNEAFLKIETFIQAHPINTRVPSPYNPYTPLDEIISKMPKDEIRD